MMFEKKITDIHIIEVGPRDGLQNEKQSIETKDKLEFIDKLVAAGLKNIEVTSFVKPDAIPQMQDSREVFEKSFQKFSKEHNISALIPNLKGYEAADKLGIKNIALFTATSNTFNQKNINATIDESFERFKPVVDAAKKSGKKIRAYISTAFGCPYEGNISIKQVSDLYARCLNELQADEIAVSDTIGTATPKQVSETLKVIEQNFGLEKCALHFHDTRGIALANILIGLEYGIKTFDSAAGGLGGCPYAKGATGNVATEDLVYLLESLGVKTGVNMDKLSQASEFIFKKIGRETTSKYLQAYLKGK